MLEYTSEELFEFLLQEAEANFSGWDFSYIQGREDQAPLSWSYVSECLYRVRKASALLDMDTGGGEIFSRFAPFPTVTFATEAYPPNIPIARSRLEPLGVQVVPLEEEEPRQLPFESQAFDLVLNRHGYYWAPEIARILRPGGVFLTQQVGNRNDIGIRVLLGAPDAVPIENWDDLASATRAFQEAGLKVTKSLEEIYPQRFYDVGALVYQLKAVPWQIPDFNVRGYFECLKSIHRQIRQDGYVEVLEHRFLLIAEKP